MDIIHVVAGVDTKDIDAEKGSDNERAVIALNSAGRLLKKKIEFGSEYIFDNANIVAWTSGLKYDPEFAIGRNPNVKPKFKMNPLNFIKRGFLSGISGEGVVMRFNVKENITTSQYVIYTSRYEGIGNLSARVKTLERYNKMRTVQSFAPSMIGGRSKRMQSRHSNAHAHTRRSKHRHSHKKKH